MPQKILAVDDQPHMLVLLERIIREETKYEFHSTNNPLEVPGILDEGSYDVVVTDLKMPGMDGLEILEHISKQKRAEKVVIITAFGDLETAIGAVQGGAFDYITKPFKKEQILHTIDRAMNWQRLEREALACHEMCSLEPYSAAETKFRREYVTRMAERCANDIKEIRSKSGLSEEEIRGILGA
jgi:DNA-binding NtrC family response regulator